MSILGQTVGEIDLGLNINQSKFNSQIKGLAQSARNPIMSAFKPIGKMLGSILAVGAIAKFTKECLDLGSDLAEVQNVVDTTFRSMSEAVNDFAADAMFQFGLSETVAKQYMGTLGAMSKSMGFSEQQAYEMSEAVTALTGDVASFYNLSSDEAFNKLKSIWTGETETLKSIGVLLTQTNLDQYALNNGFGKTTASMTEQEKVMLRYQYTMSALADASGDFAKTSGSWANQTRILSLQFDSLKATLGQGFINLFTPIIQLINALLAKLQALALQFRAFTEMLMGNRGDNSGVASMAKDAVSAAAGLDGVTDAAKKAAKATGALGIDELNVISDTSGADAMSGSMGTGIDTDILVSTEAQAEATTGKLFELLDFAKDVAEKSFSFLKENFGSNLIGAYEKIKTSALGLGAVFQKVFTDCQSFGEPFLNWMTGDLVTFTQAAIDQTGVIVSGLTDSFAMVFSDLWDLWIYPVLMNFLEVGLPMLTQFATELFDLGTELFTQVKAIFDMLWEEAVAPALGLITKIWIDFMGSLQEFWNTYGASIFASIKATIVSIGDTFKIIWNSILKPIWDNLISVVDEFWTNHLKPLVDELLSFVGELINCVAVIYNEFIGPIINWLLEVLGPVVSSVFNTIVNILEAVWAVTLDVFGGVIKTIKGIVEFISGVFTGDWEKAWQGVCDIFGGIWDSIVGIFKGVWEILKGLINGILGFVNGMLSGITNGLNGAIRALNSLKFDVPDWVPVLGGKTFGFNIPELTAPQIPLLAQGGYVGADQPQLAVIGDNKHEGEIVSPESKLLDMAVRAAELANGNNLNTEMLATIIELLTRIIAILENLDLDIELDGRSLLQSLKDSQKKLGYQF